MTGGEAVSDVGGEKGEREVTTISRKIDRGLGRD
jgi:hypothetical protein